MGCCGKHKEHLAARVVIDSGPEPSAPLLPGTGEIKPHDQCVFCAEKHISEAYDLAVERGYETPNRQKIIGSLANGARHLYVDHKELAEKVRAARHLIQMRQDEEVDWEPMLAEIDALAAAEAAKLLEEQTDKKEA